MPSFFRGFYMVYNEEKINIFKGGFIMKNFIRSILWVVVFTNLMVFVATALEVLCEHVDWIDKVMHFKVYTLEIGHAGSHLTIGALVMVYVTALIFGLLLKLWNKLVNKITNR